MTAESQALRTNSPAEAPDATPVASGAFKGLLAVLVLTGIVGFVAGLSSGNADRVWQAYLVNFLVWIGIAQGGVVLSAAFYLTQGRWAGTTQFRLAEAFVGFIPVGFVLFWGLYFGRTMIFPWVLHPIAQKAAWLNTPFLFARDGIGLLLMTLLSLALVRISRGPQAAAWQRNPNDIELPPPAIRKVAPTLGILFVVVYSLIAFDLVMSLSPQWHSTLFGWFFFAGAFWSAIVAIALTAVILRGRLGPRNALRNPTVLHDIGKLVFAFSIFWIYLVFAQYIVIWYGDIPVETFFIVHRFYVMPWQAVSYVVVLLMWAAPFIVLLGVRPKKTPAILGTIALGGIVGVWLERYLLVVPSLSPHVLPLGWVEVLITLGFFGAFMLCALPGLDLAAAAATAETWEGHE
ncbi:MAG TPA: hypothetical protein VMH37_03445 [Candidatus Binataceae bacterium]|nr:hypothetical protein [Candidatus Binataceae bacterium]